MVSLRAGLQLEDPSVLFCTRRFYDIISPEALSCPMKMAVNLCRAN